MPPMDGSVGQYRQKMADIESLTAVDEAVAAAKREEEREEQRKEAAAKKEQGNEAFKAGNIAAAIKSYTEAIELDFAAGKDEKLTAVLYSNRAAAHLKLAEKREGSARDWSWMEAEKDCRRSLQRDPHVLKCLLRAAHVCEKLSKVEDAFEFYAKALLIEPTNAVARDGATRLRSEREQISGEIDLSDADATRSSDDPPRAAGLQPMAVSARTAKYIRTRRDNRRERGSEKQVVAYTEVMALLGVAEEKERELSAEELAEQHQAKIEYFDRLRKVHDTDIVYYGKEAETSRESWRVREKERERAEQRLRELGVDPSPKPLVWQG
jgi:tetratricopeptide (TPR) repeat protein